MTYYGRLIIRIKPASGNAPARKLGPSNRVLKRHYNYQQRASFEFSKSSKIIAYTSAFLVFIGLVTLGYNRPYSQDIQNSAAIAPVEAAAGGQRPSADKVASANLAASIAEDAELPIASNISNLSISLNAKQELAQEDDSLIAKPEVVSPETSATREVNSYKAIAGDTVPKIAKKFNVRPTTVRWANNLSSDAVEPGKTLTVPARDGVVHTVSSSDTVSALANRYKANKDRIVLFNDLEQDGLKPGSKIVIPDGVAPAASQPVLVSSPSSATSSASGGSSSPLAASAVVSAGNRYDFGNCTFYAFNRRAELGRPIGSFWGNANTWAMLASAAGFTVNNTPAVGAIFQTTSGYYGHVGVVERVNPDGSVFVSEMNYRGFNVKSTRTFSPSEARSYTYIH